jgi:hypothetical protein
MLQHTGSGMGQYGTGGWLGTCRLLSALVGYTVNVSARTCLHAPMLTAVLTQLSTQDVCIMWTEEGHLAVCNGFPHHPIEDPQRLHWHAVSMQQSWFPVL